MFFTDISSFVMVLNHTYCLCISNIAQTLEIFYIKRTKNYSRDHIDVSLIRFIFQSCGNLLNTIAHTSYTHIIVNCIETTIKLQKKKSCLEYCKFHHISACCKSDSHFKDTQDYVQNLFSITFSPLSL